MCSLLPLQRCHISNAKGHADLAKHPMFKAVADCSSCPELAVDFFRHLLEDSPTKRMTAAQALHHPYLQDCFQMQQAHQGNPRFKYNSQPTQQRNRGSSKLKSIIGLQSIIPQSILPFVGDCQLNYCAFVFNGFGSGASVQLLLFSCLCTCVPVYSCFRGSNINADQMHMFSNALCMVFGLH